MIILMGVLGAGKSVQGTLLSEHTGFEWLSTGEYLRSHISGERRKEMLAGKLLDDQEIIGILKGFFDQIEDKDKCILDGFPRTLTQAKWLLDQHKSGRLKIGSIVFLNASKAVVRERLLARGRPDDTPEVLDKRFEEYETQTLPIINWFKEKGLVVHEVNAERSVDQIQDEIRSKIGQN